MSWLGDMERHDPAYPGSGRDITTTSWSRLDAEELARVLREEDEAEAAAGRRYTGRHRREGS